MCDRSHLRREIIEGWKEDYPEGRHFYYEGNDPAGFVKEIKSKFGIDATVSFNCPPEFFDEIYEYPLGT